MFFCAASMTARRSWMPFRVSPVFSVCWLRPSPRTLGQRIEALVHAGLGLLHPARQFRLGGAQFLGGVGEARHVGAGGGAAALSAPREDGDGGQGHQGKDEEKGGHLHGFDPLTAAPRP